MDLVLDVIDREPSLDIIDVGTGFLAAVFLDGQDSSTVWNAFVMCRSCLFIVLGIRLRWARVKYTTTPWGSLSKFLSGLSDYEA
jgi:hypothetical protein